MSPTAPTHGALANQDVAVDGGRNQYFSIRVKQVTYLGEEN